MEISTTLGSKFSLQELGEYIVTKSASVMGTHQAILFLQGEDDSYFPQAFKGFPQQDWEKLRLPPSLPLIKWLASHKAPFIKGEMQEVISPEVFQKFYGEFEKFLGEITIPLLLKKELRGVLALGRKETEEIYTQRDINLLLTLTQEAAIAIENIRMLEEHQQLLQKQAEAKAREEYIAQIRQKDRELLEAYEELDKARASLSQMKVADEIKDPLTGILGSSQLALEKLKGKVTFDAEVLQKYFKIIEEQTKKIKEILRKFPQPP
jgi:GAF domain-containing protein